jgi:hypothetical protein
LKTKQVQKEKGEVEIENCPVLSKCLQIKGVYVKGKLYFERSKIDSIKLYCSQSTYMSAVTKITAAH